ncbi:hypothetical protein C8J57DRAFT_1253404 [Mycena rebaudengoi]|nr:hypothetical protein C8J57DRAFT_1253404 [Mycena rebaudengoi]
MGLGAKKLRDLKLRTLAPKAPAPGSGPSQRAKTLRAAGHSGERQLQNKNKTKQNKKAPRQRKRPRTGEKAPRQRKRQRWRSGGVWGSLSSVSTGKQVKNKELFEGIKSMFRWVWGVRITEKQETTQGVVDA